MYPRCVSCYNKSTHQRNLDIFGQPFSIQPKECRISGEELQVVCNYLLDNNLLKFSALVLLLYYKYITLFFRARRTCL